MYNIYIYIYIIYIYFYFYFYISIMNAAVMEVPYKDAIGNEIDICISFWNWIP